MPEAVEYDPKDKDLQSAAAKELSARRGAYQLAQDYYDGEHKAQLQAEEGQPDNNITLNLAKKAVDRIISFLVPKFPRLKLDELGDSAEDKWLNQAWAKNKGAILLHKIAKNGCFSGHAFTRVMEPTQPDGWPRIINLNPANCLAFWAADDVDTVLWYSIYWSSAKWKYRQDIVDQGGMWGIYDWRAANTVVPQSPMDTQLAAMLPDKQTDVQWQRTGEAEWNYPLSPIVDWQHFPVPNAYYGESEFGNIRLNDQVNKVNSDISEILRFHASPRTVGTGVEAGDLQESAINSFWTIADKDAKVFNLEMQSDLASSREYAKDLENDFYAERRITVLTGSPADFQRVTNLGVRMLYVDQLSKNTELQRQYELGISGISMRVRMVAGRSDYETEPKTMWFDALPSDPLEAVQVAQGEKTLGVISVEGISENLNIDHTLEQERIKEEATSVNGMMEQLMQRSFPAPAPQQPLSSSRGSGDE